MKIVFFAVFVIFLTQRQIHAGVVRKPPAFATPVYSSSYLPAAMQVIFHSVDQLKHLEAEEMVSTSPSTTLALPTTSPHAPGQHQPSIEEVSMQSMDSAAYEASTASIAYMASTASELSTDVTSSEAFSVSEAVTAPAISDVPSLPEVVTDTTVSESSTNSHASATSLGFDASTNSAAFKASVVSAASEISAASDASITSQVLRDSAIMKSEVLASSTISEAIVTSTVSTSSTAAINPTGSTPNFMDIIEASHLPVLVLRSAGEINEEKPEVMEEVTATNESKAETPEENYATPEINHEVQETGQEEIELNQELPEKNESEQQSVISSLSSTTQAAETSVTNAFPKPHNNEDSSEEDEGETNSSEEWIEKHDESESKPSAESNSDEEDSSEEEDDEIRFTLIGEKVSQVPRPSLSNYLRKTAKAPLRSSVQDLATLYDALSKDARKQGLGKYSGYTDEVLETLVSSIEGGVGPQLRTLLEKAQERNELTRDDTKKKLSVTLKKLADPASILSRDLRRLIPLRYIP